jgi:pimeloyl-ACP methyl ester carboxylesterase
MFRRCFPVIVILLAGSAQAAPLEFQLTYGGKGQPEAFTGRVFVLLSKQRISGPPTSPNWFNPQPMFAFDVQGWKPNQPITIGSNAIAFPRPLAELEKGTYWVIGFMDLDHGHRSFGAAPGNRYSEPRQLELDPAASGPVKLILDQVVQERPFKETDTVKLVEIDSGLLAAFHCQAMKMRAAVVLPKSYATEPNKKYPVIYEIPGFGGDHRMAFGSQRRTDVAGTEMLFVVLDPSCRNGHHVFADSANNGPWGEALVKELIPAIESKFRAIGTPGSRFVTGHSSGGWSSLWLQATYPDFFGGVWSTAPDPVDFRDFQRINIYKPAANMFFDEEGKRRPIARNSGKAVLFYKPFSDMEDVIGHGGQLPSFEAVFSPRGPKGQPSKLWDRKTGKIDPEIAKAWEKYDIRLVLERNWKTLGPKLAGKLHVYMGGEDTFYLEGATKLLKESLANLGSDAKIEIFPGKNHGSLMDQALRQRIAREMAEQFRKNSVSEKASPR